MKTLRTLTIIVANEYIHPPLLWANLPIGKNSSWRMLINWHLREYAPLYVHAYQKNDIFRETFIAPHLGSNGFIKNEDYNLLYLAEWEGEHILYTLINALVEPSEEVNALRRNKGDERIDKPGEWEHFEPNIETEYEQQTKSVQAQET